jgi:hypothetical protein
MLLLLLPLLLLLMLAPEVVDNCGVASATQAAHCCRKKADRCLK